MKSIVTVAPIKDGVHKGEKGKGKDVYIYDSKAELARHFWQVF